MIYILAKYPFLSVGHYWTFDGYLRNALRELELNYVFINPDAFKAEQEDKKINNKVFTKYINVANDDNFLQNSIKIIENDIKELKFNKVVILIPWLPQFTLDELRFFNRIESKAIITYVGLTIIAPDQIKNISTNKPRYQFEEFFMQKENKILWVSDTPPAWYIDKSWIREMPDFAESGIIKKVNPKYDLSFFGLLTPYRGLFEILIIALFNPKIKIRIKGYGYSSHRIFRPWKRKVFRYQNWRTNPMASIVFSSISLLVSGLRYLPNVTFSSEPFANELDLDKAIGETRAMFYCPKLPHGSGLSNKSLAAGIPILWFGWSGQAYRLLKTNFSEGNFRFSEIFVPGRIYKKLNSLPIPKPIEVEMRNNFLNEVSILKKFI